MLKEPRKLITVDIEEDNNNKDLDEMKIILVYEYMLYSDTLEDFYENSMNEMRIREY